MFFEVIVGVIWIVCCVVAGLKFQNLRMKKMCNYFILNSKYSNSKIEIKG